MTTGVGLSPCCLSGILHQGTPSGKEEVIGGLDTYVAEPKSKSKDKSIVILTDIFGWKLPNVRLLADEYADKGGFTVYIPDVLNGDPLPFDFLQDVEPPKKVRDELSVVDKGAKTAKVGVTLPPWLVKHREGVSKPIIEGFISEVRKIPGTSKVGAVGFCWGGRYAILMAHGGLVDAAFAAHPSLVAIPDDFDPVTMPLSLAVGDSDSLLSEDQVQQIRGILDKKATPTELRVYASQVHGFALRGDHSSDLDKKAQDDAAQQAVDWFEKHLSG